MLAGVRFLLTSAALDAAREAARRTAPPPVRLRATVLAPLGQVLFRRDRDGGLLLLHHPAQDWPASFDPLWLALLLPEATQLALPTRPRRRPAYQWSREALALRACVQQMAPVLSVCPFGCASPQQHVRPCPIAAVLAGVPLPD